MKPLSYSFSPSLLDAYQRMVDTKPEEFFYQDETGWHKNWSEKDETFHLSEEQVDAILRKEFIDSVNKVPTAPSEAASKGTAFNEIVDCLVKKCKPTKDGVFIKTVRCGEDLFDIRVKKAMYEADALGKKGIVPETMTSQESMEQFSKINEPFIYASVDGFEFFFDIGLCLEAAEYFKNSICQYYTKCELETGVGVVELHGYIDYLNENRVYDAKTTKEYKFGNYQKRWQRYAYPFSLIESGVMNEVSTFEFTVYVLRQYANGLIKGEQYKEVYTYDHEYARTMLMQQCERVAAFLEENRNEITNKKVFGIKD